MTIIITLFELTGNYQIILPLMLATVMSTISSRLSGHESLYTSQLSRRGVHLHQGQGIDVMQGITIREGMSEPEVTVPLSMTLPELARTFEKTHSHGFPVLDEDGLLAGFPDEDPHQTPEPEHRELQIPARARCCNTAIRDLSLPEECLIVSIERDGEVLVAHGHTPLRAGDVVELFGLPDDLDAAAALLSRR